MILVVISSATINGVVFGVVNNFGVFYAYLTELSKTDITALGFSNSNHEDQITTTISTVNISLTANMTTTTTLDAVVQSLIGMFVLFRQKLIIGFITMAKHTLQCPDKIPVNFVSITVSVSLNRLIFFFSLPSSPVDYVILQ